MTGTPREVSPSRRIVIVGGGITAWMAAAALVKAVRLEDWSICVVHADNADRFAFAAADATLPLSGSCPAALELDEDWIVREAGGAFTLGIALSGWSSPDATYFHPFGSTGAGLGPVAFHHLVMRLRSEGVRLRLADYSMAALAAQSGRFSRPGADPRSVLSTCRYGLHLDCEKTAMLMRAQAETMGVESFADSMTGAELADDGTIAAIRTQGGKRIEGDLFLDCTGADAQLIGTLETGWEDWSAWLPCDRFVTARVATAAPPAPYSVAVATRAGWIRYLPLQDATWLTCLHSRSHSSRAEALDVLRRAAGDTELERMASGPIRFGRRIRAWQRNCIAMGTSAVVIDPVATSNLHLLRSAIARLLKLLPGERSARVEAAEYNRLTALEQDHARDFAVLHYKLNRRQGEPLWDACRTMPVPDALEYKCRSYESRGRIAMYDEEPLEEASWLNIFDEHGLRPRRYSPMADGFGTDELKSHCEHVRAIMIEELAKMPLHGDYLSRLRSPGDKDSEL